MAKKSSSVAVATLPLTTSTTDGRHDELNQVAANKAQAIRDYKAANPEAGPAAIAKALTAQGVEVNASRVSTVLNGGNRQKSTGLTPAEQVRLAAMFLKSYKGDAAAAEAAIGLVGDFVSQCGGKDEALAALTMYSDIKASLA